jgi:hypothetical protein
MFKEYKDQQVNVLVASRGDVFLEYFGTVVEETEKTLKLKNVNILYAAPQIQRNILGSGMAQFKTNLNEAVINKEYIIGINS